MYAKYSALTLLEEVHWLIRKRRPTENLRCPNEARDFRSSQIGTFETVLYMYVRYASASNKS